jgi:hypothetical protein
MKWALIQQNNQNRAGINACPASEMKPTPKISMNPTQ